MNDNCNCSYCKEKVNEYFCIRCLHNYNECESYYGIIETKGNLPQIPNPLCPKCHPNPFKIKLSGIEPITIKLDWKKYPDEKPDEDQNCLVCCGDADNRIPHKAYYCDGYFRSLETNCSYPLLVTMWMPLPELPK